MFVMLNSLNNAEGHIVAMRSQLQDAVDRKGSSDINTRQIEDTAQHHYDSLLEQLKTANQKLWHVEANAENVVGEIENQSPYSGIGIRGKVRSNPPAANDYAKNR